MDLLSLRETVAWAEPPAGVSLALAALWWDAKGDWEKAHRCAQERDDEAGMWVHAYLHRKDGDLSNADYWYRRCRKTPPKVSLAEEWENLARSFLSQTS
ncbi:MAG: hypothetical protein AB7F09_16250 [Parvibaculaceae bacterium]